MANVAGKVISFKYESKKKKQKSEGEERTRLKSKKRVKVSLKLATAFQPGDKRTLWSSRSLHPAFI